MIYLACIVGYLLLLGAIGIWKSRSVKDQSDFAVAGRSLSPWMMVCTMLAVWIGTGSILGNAEETYKTGMAAFLLPTGTFLGMILLSLIAARARHIEASSVPEIIERRYGTAARNLAMLSLVIAYMVIVSYQFNAGGAVLEVIVGDRKPITVEREQVLSKDQLTRGRLRYTADSEGDETLRLTVRSVSDANIEQTLVLEVVEPKIEAEPVEGDDAAAPGVISVVADHPARIYFDGANLTGRRFVVTEVPGQGTLELIDPIVTARQATLLAAVFIIVYAALAGLLSLAWMDLVTGSIIMLTMLIAFPIYWSQAGGWSGIESAFVASGRPQHVALWGVYSYTELSNYILPVFLLVLGDANQYQRIFASRSSKGARSAVTMMIFIAFAIELLIIGCAWIASSMTPDPENGKYILIYAARHYLALPLGCLFMVTVVAIIISTADSFLHVPAASVVNDLYLKYISPKATQKHTIFISRVMVVFFGAVAYLVTLMFSESTGFFRKALYAFTIYGVCITPSLVAALTWRRATRQGAIASIVSGAIVTLAWGEVDIIRESLPASLAGLDAVLPAITISVGMLIGVSLLTRQSADSSLERRGPNQGDLE